MHQRKQWFYLCFLMYSTNQLTRESNPTAGKTWMWEYDNAGNILSRKQYSSATSSLGGWGLLENTAGYTYGEKNQIDGWGDLLTAYNGQTISYDTIGNPLSDGTWSYSWENGRQLASMTGNGAHAIIRNHSVYKKRLPDSAGAM